MTKQKLLDQLKARLDDSEKLCSQLREIAKDLNLAMVRMPKSEWDENRNDAVQLDMARIYTENAEEKQDKTSVDLYAAIKSLENTPERLLEQSARSDAT